MPGRIVVVLALLLTLSSFAFPQDSAARVKENAGKLIRDLHKHQWTGAQIVGESPTMWDFGFTEPMRKLLKIGSPAQEILLPYLKDESIKDQIIILLGGVGDTRVIPSIIDAMIDEKDSKTVPNAKRINRAANLALTNITAAQVIWGHGGGVVVERCPDNPKECWSKWWKINRVIFRTEEKPQSRGYSNYPDYNFH